ncbi:putative C-type lectin domain family 20 member A [Brienomyrus brachyistius]|uniref:putative C-type lectin domain family 20 member A n=1 Tax=Brienomyrus brachyistius TaxID=42636 RepID=UPI0020B29E58|nr:putative C-type lectin domain family 20 member A [Brienomyrus brachyistius]
MDGDWSQGLPVTLEVHHQLLCLTDVELQVVLPASQDLWGSKVNWPPNPPRHTNITENRKEWTCLLKAPTYKDGINATWNFTWINQHRNWSDAQSYCRYNYTDLATVRNQEDNDLIHTMVTNGTWVWIGLFQDTWEWSDLSNSSFRNWKNGQNDYVNNACALAQVTWPGTWDVTPCVEQHPFICYDDCLILVNRTMTWNVSLNYCRTHYFDLASVQNKEIQYWVSRRAEKASTDHVWLGLRFSCSPNFWFWVSSENVSYQTWPPNNISNSNLCETTGAVQSGNPDYWVSLPETEELNFMCSICPSKVDLGSQGNNANPAQAEQNKYATCLFCFT